MTQSDEKAASNLTNEILSGFSWTSLEGSNAWNFTHDKIVQAFTYARQEQAEYVKAFEECFRVIRHTCSRECDECYRLHREALSNLDKLREGEK